jgi:Ca2+-binding EF-hand superfamily protein
MKKLMLGVAAVTMALTLSAPSFAREETRVVGYVNTETYISDRDNEFARIDDNKDGVISFKEFQRHAMLENEYEIFNMNDNDKDKVLSLQEWRDFSKTGPSRNDGGYNTSNFNKRPTP